MKSFKIYPSSAAFMRGPLVDSKKNSGCIRFIAARHYSGLSREELTTDIAPEYQAIGALDEHLFAMRLEKRGIQFEREVPFKIEFKQAVISGRMDFVLADGTIIEKKSTTSAHVYKRVFEQGVPEPSHLAQLVSYLAFLNKPRGQIVVSYWEADSNLESYQMVEEKVFTVETDGKNVLTVDGEPSTYSVRDLARWYALVEQNLSQDLTTGTLEQEPCQTSKYESPCNFCPLKKICETSNSGTTLAEFTERAIPALLAQTPARPFKIAVNTERRKKNRQEKINARTSRA